MLGAATFLLIGWSGLLVPSLIRSIEDDLAQTDAGLGLLFFVWAAAYAAGSFAGGAVTEHVGRRSVLAAGLACHGTGLLVLGVAPAWPVFLLAAVPAGLGAGSLDGGVNGLFLDAFPIARTRALNGLHVFFSIGALACPLVVGGLVDAGVGWRPLILGSGLAALALVLGYLIVAMPHGRRTRPSAQIDRSPGAILSWPLILLAVAITAYVASEVGVSSWLVRFLAAAPLRVATLALSVFWTGLALGRLLSARFGDRVEPIRLATASAGVATAALVAAVLAPSLPVSIGLFGLVGFASGPIFPTIIALGGERYPSRSAAISGLLTGFAVVGSVAYPPLMGFLSVELGLTVAMLGAALLCGVCAVALLLVAGASRRLDRHAIPALEREAS